MQLGLISQEATHSLGRGALGLITPDVTMTLGETTVMGIPVMTWVTVAGLAAGGGAAGAWAFARSPRAAVGGTVGGLLGGLLSVAVVSLLTKPQAPAASAAAARVAA